MVKRSEAIFTVDRTALEALIPSGVRGAQHLVDKIFMVVAGAIQARSVGTGVRLPSVRQLADDCQVSRDTAVRAYDKLVAHGLVESRRGSGYFVKGNAPRRLPERVVVSRPSLFHPTKGLDAVSRFRLLLQRPAHSLASRTGVGTLPEEWMDEPRIGGAFRAVTRSSQRSLAVAGDPQGYLPLRHQLQIKLQDAGINVQPANIIVTGGASDALNLILLSFLRRPGEVVLVEQPCQPMLLDRLLSVGLDIAAVPRLADGPDLEALTNLCRVHKPRYFFLSAALHNPTGTHLAPHKAFQILKLAGEFDLTLVEDDTYGDLLTQGSGSAVSRLAPLDQLQRVIYVGSFSKTLAPGLRVGYLAASAERIEWMATYRALNCMAGNSLAERAVYQLLSQGNYRHHCEQLRARLAAARPRVVETLRSHGIGVGHEPTDGMYVWANLGDGIDAFAVAQRMLEQGHLMAPGALFSKVHPSFMRFNVAATVDSKDTFGALARLMGR